MTNKHIGTITDEGVQWPEVTISGQPYIPPPAQYRMIGPDTVVALDAFPAMDQYGKPLFDVEAAIEKLKPKSEVVIPSDLTPEAKADVLADAGVGAAKGKK